MNLIKEYSFEVADAEIYGVEEAVMLKNIKFWIAKNQANEKNQKEIEIEGAVQLKTWTYNSIRAFSELFPFWTDKQIRRILDNLIKKGALIVGNFNKVAYDRTRWFALSDEYIRPKLQIELPKQANQSDQTVQPIPYNKPDSKPNDKPYIKIAEKVRTKPDKQEVYEYIKEHPEYEIDVEYFYDYYESIDWKVGSKKMKDWKATVRNWKRNESKFKKNTKDQAFYDEINARINKAI